MTALWSSFAVVALAEMGDKTQLVALTLASRYRRPWTVMLGILVATVLNHALAAFIGAHATGALPQSWLAWALGGSFIAFGFWALVPDRAESARAPSRWGPLLTSAAVFFVAEMGDKTQLATLSRPFAGPCLGPSPAAIQARNSRYPDAGQDAIGLDERREGGPPLGSAGEPALMITRRTFLSLTAGATALGLQPRSVGALPSAAPSGSPLPDPADAPFDTVVVLMMENRSFDHFLGWLPGANGRQQGLSYLDQAGVAHETWPLAPDFQGCLHGDPDHSWEGARTHYANGRCDGFLLTAPAGDRFSIGYYREGDLPIMTALAKGYTVFDSYFCSMLGPTWQNRLYQLTGTTQLTADCDFPKSGEPRPVTIPTAIFDRVCAAGLTAGYYYHAEPMTGIFESRRYDDISHPIEQFWADAANGALPNVVFVDPNYTDRAEDLGTSNDYHPWGNVLVAEGFVADVHNALRQSPQWGRMVFVLNFDEDGGFFDHVPPPACQDDTVLVDRGSKSNPGGGGRFPDLRRLGIRVPAIAMGPFAPRKIHAAGPYEHCSILKMIEWRWGLEPLTLRDRTARNFAEALDFTRRRDPIELARFTPPPPPTGCAAGGGWTEVPVYLNWVKVPCDGPPGAVCAGRVMVGETLVATAAPRTIGSRGAPVLWMTLTPSGRQLMGRLTSPRSVRAVVETTLVEGSGPVCHRSGAVILVPQPLLR